MTIVVLQIKTSPEDVKIYVLQETLWRLHMSKKDKDKKIQKSTESDKSVESSDRGCCCFIDRCGCYVDPCCCSPSYVYCC